MNIKASPSAIFIVLLMIAGFSTGILAQENQTGPSPTTRFYVWASTGPLSYLADAKIIIRDAKGALVARGKTNHRGIVGFRLPNKKLRQLPLRIQTLGGSVNDQSFHGQLKALAYEVGGKTPIVYLDLVSTTARQMKGPRMTYEEATSAVRQTLRINQGAAVDTLRVGNPYVDGQRLNKAIEHVGSYDQFVRELSRLAKAGEYMDGLQPPKAAIKRRGQSQSALILNDALNPEQAPQQLEATATTQSNSSTLCTTAVPSSENTTVDYGAIATASLLEVVGLPLAATDGVTGMLLSSVGLSDTSPTTEALDNIAEELDCISSQLQYIEAELAEIETLVDYDTLQTELTNANSCASGLNFGWSLYNALANGADGAINNSNPNLCVSTGGASCGGGDINTWQGEVNFCTSKINDALFGTGGDAGGSAWAELNILYQSQYAWYTQAQAQALQSFLSYWSTMIYYQSVLQNEVYNFYGQFGLAVTTSGSPGNGSPGCAYSQPTPNENVCQWQSNIQFAFPGNLYSDEIGLLNGTAINAFPGGLTFSSSATALSAEYLANTYWAEGGPHSWSYDYDASTLVANSQTIFNNQGINPAGNGSAIETYDSPQALRTLTITSGQISALNSPQTPGGLTASNFFFQAVNQINGWPTSDGYSATNTGYYTSDNVSKVSGSYVNNGYQQFDNVSVDINSTIAAASPNVGFVCFSGTTTCSPNSGNVFPIMAALMGRTWWSGANNATNQSFYELLPPPLTVPNAPTLTGVSGSTGQINVSFDPVPSSEDGGQPITAYVASCTLTNTSTVVTASAMASPISVINLTPGSTYTCSIQAQNASGLSLVPATCPIASCSATVSASTVPSQPTALTATAGYLQLSLAFTPPTNTGGSSITGYLASCTSQTSGASTGTANGTSSPIVVTGLTGGAKYACSLVAQNVNGNSTAATVIATPLTPIAPSAPTLTYLGNYNNNGQVGLLLEFNAPSETGGVALSEYLGTCTSTNAPTPLTFTGTVAAPASDLGIAGSGTSWGYIYTCTVQVKNSAGLVSPASNALTASPSS
jgi:hypothetical protein